MTGRRRGSSKDTDWWKDSIEWDVTEQGEWQRARRSVRLYGKRISANLAIIAVAADKSPSLIQKREKQLRELLRK